MKQRIALTKVVRKRYQKANKKEKTKILSEMVANCGYNRSYARRILGSLKTERKMDRKGKGERKGRKYSPRPRKYDASVFYPLRTLWLAVDGICSQRLKPFIPELLEVLEKKKELSEIYENLNPMEMKRKINKLTEKLNKTIVTKIHDLTNMSSVT